MLWKVRTRVRDRPGTLARLAAGCGQAGVNILGLQVFPTPEGVVDELVLSTPTQWVDTDVVALVVEAGGNEVSATECSLRALQDPALRYLQTAVVLQERGGSLATALEQLLETGTPDAADYVGHDELSVRTRDGQEVVVRRAVRFTPTERARAEALVTLLDAGGATARPAAPRLDTQEQAPGRDPCRPVTIRPARLSDIDALVAMHRRCSPRTLAERYHSCDAQGTELVELARMQVQAELPTVVAAVDDRVLGAVTRAPGVDQHSVRFGLLVEDAQQRRGIGAALLTAAARAAAQDGARELVLVARPGNDALLRTVGRCGFSARLRRVDGNVGLTVGLTRLAGSGQSVAEGTLVRGLQA